MIDPSLASHYQEQAAHFEMELFSAKRKIIELETEIKLLKIVLDSVRNNK